MQWIIYVDMDAFYLSCELVRHPELRGRAAMVAHDPKEGMGRGVVLSASYEARALGFRSAMPVKEAWRRHDQVVWLPPDFGFYEETSRRVVERLRARNPLVRTFSIDEAAYPWEGETPAGALAEGKDVQRVLREELSLPASVGISIHLSVAKVASDRAKPGGVVVVAPGEMAGFLAPLPVTSLPGVGPVTSEALKRIGVERVTDLTTVPFREIKGALGPVARSYVALARGEPEREPWPEETPPRSFGSMVTFDEDLTEEPPLFDQISKLCGSLAATLKESQNLFRGVTVQVRWEDLDRMQKSRSLPHPTDDPATLVSTARALLLQLLRDRERRARGVRTLGLSVKGLQPADTAQRKLDV